MFSSSPNLNEEGCSGREWRGPGDHQGREDRRCLLMELFCAMVAMSVQYDGIVVILHKSAHMQSTRKKGNPALQELIN